MSNTNRKSPKRSKSRSTPIKLGKCASMKRASALLDCSLSELKQLKSSGAPGFDDHGRVDLDLVQKFMRMRDRRLRKEAIEREAYRRDYCRCMEILAEMEAEEAKESANVAPTLTPFPLVT